MPPTRSSCPRPVRCCSSRQTTGERPCSAASRALASPVPAGIARTRAMISRRSAVSRQSLFCGGGKRYATPGRISRSDDMLASTRRRASMILPSLPTRIALLYRPITSTIRVRRTGSPSSLTVSKSRQSSRSSPGWRTARRRAPVRRLRSSMQSMGGCFGFSGMIFVKWMRALSARAETIRRREPSFRRSEKTSSSRAG